MACLYVRNDTMAPALEWYTRYDFFTTVDIRLRYWVFDIVGIVFLLCYALIVAQNRRMSTGSTRVMIRLGLHLTPSGVEVVK